MMQKLVIGCGYLGTRVAQTWLKQGATVAALTRTPQHAEELSALGIEPVLGDVTRPATLANLPPADTILYAVGFDRSSGRTQREIYVDGLDNVLRQIAREVRRLLYVSSTSVYGQTGGEWVDESSACEPQRDRGRVCLDAEHVVWRHFPPQRATSQQGANVLRLSGIYGPGRLLSRIESLKSQQPLPGNPDAYLNLIHVDDAVRTILACENSGQPGTTYLVSDDKPLRRREYYAALAALVEAPSPVFAEENAFHAQPDLGKRCSNRRIREELGVDLAFPTIETGLPHALVHSD